MNRDDVIRMAREAGLHIATDHDWMPIIALAYAQKFAEIVRAEEREACAKVAEQIEREVFNAVGDPRVSEFKPKIAAAIRARGQE
jgi:hypothetical protein